MVEVAGRPLRLDLDRCVAIGATMEVLNKHVAQLAEADQISSHDRQQKAEAEQRISRGYQQRAERTRRCHDEHFRLLALFCEWNATTRA